MVHAPPPLPRADEPVVGGRRHGAFDFATLRLQGVSLPVLLLAGYLLVATSALDEEWPLVGRLRPRLLLGGAALVVAALRAFRGGLAEARPPDGSPAPTLAWAALLVAGTLSTVWAFEFGLAVQAWTRHATSLFTYLLIIALVRTRRDLLVTVLAFVAGHAVYLLRSVQEYLNGKIDSQMGVSRMLGAGTANADPNSFAATVAFSLPLVVWVGLRARSVWVRLAVAAYGALAAFSIVRTHSRSGLVLLGLNLLWTLAVLPRHAARVALLAAVLVGGVWGSSALTENAAERYASILTSSTYKEEESTRGRIDGYVVGWRIFTERPLLGVGPGYGSWSAYRVRRVDGDPLLPHNLFGQLIATLGLIGTVAFAAYVGLSLRAMVAVAGRSAPEEPAWDAAARSLARAMLFLLALLLVSGLAAHNLEREAWAYAPALALVAGSCRRDHAHPPEPDAA